MKEAYKFCEAQKLKEIVQKFSQFANFPIYIYEEVSKQVEVDLTEEEIEEKTKKEDEKEEAERDYDFPKTKMDT